MVLTFKSVDEMKATEQYFPVVLFIMLYKVILIFTSVEGIPRCETTKLNVFVFFHVLSLTRS